MKKDNQVNTGTKAEIIALPLKQGRFNGASEIAKNTGYPKEQFNLY
jgi:hypothetical protein